MSSFHIYYHLLLIMILLIDAFLACGPLGAKEDTAYLTFQRSASSRPGTTVYTVKKGEWLLDIARRVTGETRHAYTMIRKYNPGIKNLNRIYPGQKIIFPVKATAAVSSAETSPLSPPPLSRQTGVMKDDMSYPSPTKWTLVKHVLGQIGATVTSQGKYYLPLRDMGQITIDCGKIPMVEFTDRGIVFIDFRNQIPDNLRQLVSTTWKQYAIIKVNPQLEASVLLEQIILASNTHTMTRQELPLRIGLQPVLQIPASWIITGKTSMQTSSPHAIALWNRSEATYGLPESLQAYAAAKGWKIIEVVREKIVKPAPDDAILSRPVPRLSSQSSIDLADDFLHRIGLQTQRNAELKIFDSARDGFDLKVQADLLVSKANQRLIFMSKILPDQFRNILRNNGTEIIFVMAGETNKSLLEKSCRALNIPCEFSTFTFPVGERTEQAGMAVSFTALKISPDNNKVLYLIDFDMDERLNGFLAEKMGVPVIRY